jgi:DNA gyrase subunit A
MISPYTGLGPIETTVLATIAEAGALPDRPHHKCSNIIAATTDTGFSPRYVYEVITELGSDWKVPLTLVDGHGNFGSPDPHDRPANPRYTEARLTFVGALAVEAEHNVAPPVPIDLVNGDVYRGGRRPPFRAAAISAALRAAANGADDTEIAALVGAPMFPTRCDVDTDLDALLAGQEVTLTCRATVNMREDGAIELRNFPPGSSAETAGQAIFERVNNESRVAEYPELREKTSLFLRDVRNESAGSQLLVCVPRRDADTRVVRDRLLGIWGVHKNMQASLGAPVGDLLRHWVDRHGAEATVAGTQRLDDAMRRDADRS